MRVMTPPARQRPLLLPRLAACCCALLLGACATTRTPAPVREAPPPARIEAPGPGDRAAAPATAAAMPTEKRYTVKKGDTLISIALDHGVDYRDLVTWNSLENPNRIRPGQMLRVTRPEVSSVDASSAGDAGTEVRPIAIGAAPVARGLDDAAPVAPSLAPAAPAASAAVLPAPTFSAQPNQAPHGDHLKRAPKGGKLPYSEENFARLKAQDAVPVPIVTAAAIVPTAPPTSPAPALPAATPNSATKPPLEKPVPVEKPAVAEKPAAPEKPASSSDIDWAWPSAGQPISRFGEGADGETKKGLDLAGKPGDPVLAAAAGKVIYVGTMKNYGNLVIVLHAAGHSSVYAHNSKILVKEQQVVTRGQKIAELGDSDADQPKLHFEIRQQGKPVDPLKLLPAR